MGRTLPMSLSPSSVGMSPGELVQTRATHQQRVPEPTTSSLGAKIFPVQEKKNRNVATAQLRSILPLFQVFIFFAKTRLKSCFLRFLFQDLCAVRIAWSPGQIAATEYMKYFSLTGFFTDI